MVVEVVFFFGFTVVVAVVFVVGLLAVAAASVVGVAVAAAAATREDRQGDVEAMMRRLDEGLDGVRVFDSSSEVDLRLRPRVIMGIEELKRRIEASQKTTTSSLNTIGVTTLTMHTSNKE